MSKKGNSVRPLRVTVSCALLVALSIVCGKVLQFPVGEAMRFSLENLPILFACAAFGPMAGATVGAIADLIGCLVVGYAINPLVTLGAVAIGLVGGGVYRLTARLPLVWRMALTVAIAHLVGSVGIKSFGLAQFYQFPFGELVLWRLLNYAIVGVVEAILLIALFKNKSLRTVLRGIGMDYKEALEYIHSVNWTFCKPGLERITALCRALGDPQTGMRFIHVAGTNGKGSFCAMTDAILRSAGYRVGLFTSPYIKTFNERMRIDGTMIDEQELADLTAFVRPIADAMEDKPTEFELITAIALLYFRRHDCDVVVLEAGMGGRLDSTNVIREPLLSVITGIALDHTAFLGDTVEKIAAEKAGIIKDNRPVLYGGEDLDACRVIEDTAKERGSAFYTVDYSDLSVTRADLNGAVLDFGEYKDVTLNLLGTYQPRNAAVVLRAVDLLRAEGLIIPERAVREGLATVVWHGRFELLANDPPVIFDGAHNAQGVAAAVDGVRRYFGTQKVYVMTGVLQDKDYHTIARAIASVASRAFVLTPDNPRALAGEEYASLLEREGVPSTAYPSAKDAFIAAKAAAKEQQVPLICLGSLYTYASLDL